MSEVMIPKIELIDMLESKIADFEVKLSRIQKPSFYIAPQTENEIRSLEDLVEEINYLWPDSDNQRRTSDKRH